MFNQEALKKLIDEGSPYYERRREWNQSLSIVVGLLGIGLSLGATISGIALKDGARIAAIFGACAATTSPDDTNGHSPTPNGKAAATDGVSVPSQVSSNPPADF